MLAKKNDFIELEFTGKIKETGEVFDAAGPKIGKDPLKLCIGHEMILQSLDKELEEKEVGKEYHFELAPEKAFGKRDNSLIKTIPISVFHEHDIEPNAGIFYNIDGLLVKIISVSSGRVITDFNNPLSGKNLVYDFKILKIIDNEDEKIKILVNAYLGLDDKSYDLIQKEKPSERYLALKKDLGDRQAVIDALKTLDSRINQLVEKAKSVLKIDLKLEY